MDNENEGVDSTTNDDNQDVDKDLENTEEETEEQSEEETNVDVLNEKNKNLFARAKKAEAELKKIKKVDSSKEAEAKDTSSEYLTKDEAVLIAKGMELEEMEQLKLIQKGMGGTLKEALESPLYQGYTKQKAVEDKRKKAQLGASSGSGEKEVGFDKEDITAEEHRALWDKENK